MRVLFVSHNYPPHGVTGVERVTEWSASALSAAGHSVTVLTRLMTAAPHLPKLERGEWNGIPVARICGGAGYRHDLRQSRLDRIFERVLLEMIPDVVVFSHLMNHTPGYISTAQRLGVRTVVELHDFYAACERAHLERPSGELCSGPEGGRACAAHCFAGPEGALARWALRTHEFRRALAQADAVLAPSPFVAEYFTRRYDTRSPIKVLPNGVALAPQSRVDVAPRPTDRPLHLASLGAVVEHKGAHVVVDALRKARLTSVRYTLFGSIVQPYAHNLREQASRVPGLDLQIFGSYDADALPLLLTDVDVVVVPSIVWESFSIVSREAMACGVPVLASRFGALAEAVDEGKNGWLFPAGSSSDLAALLQMLHGNRRLLDQLSHAARASDWISAAERARKLERLLETVTHQAGIDGPLDGEQLELDLMRISLGALSR